MSITYGSSVLSRLPAYNLRQAGYPEPGQGGRPRNTTTSIHMYRKSPGLPPDIFRLSSVHLITSAVLLPSCAREPLIPAEKTTILPIVS